MRYRYQLWGLLRLTSVFVFSFTCAAVPGMSDVTSSGLGTTVTTSGAANNIFTIQGGTRNTSNLFHSFGDFDLVYDATNPESAVFSNNQGGTITNVIGRITGGASTIDGSVSFDGTLSGANLFLINPAGIVFGNRASIDIPGSLHVSTANSINLGADVFNSATTIANIGSFGTASPTSFGFLAGNTSTISAVAGSNFTAGTDGTISLIGGSGLSIDGTLVANSGRINLASVNASAAVATVSNLNSGTLTITGTRGAITTSNARLDVSGLSSAASGDANGAGGDVYIIGGDLTLNSSSITSELFSDATSGNIVLNGTGAVTLNDTDINTGHDQGLFIPGFTIDLGFFGMITIPAINIPAVVKGTGNAGDVFITGDTVKIENGSNIFSKIEALPDVMGMPVASGDSGSVRIVATDATDVADFATFNATPTNADIIIDNSSIYTEASGGGASGDVEINAGRTPAGGGFFFFGGGNQPIDVDTLYLNNADIYTTSETNSSTGSVILNATYARLSGSEIHSDTNGSEVAGYVGLTGNEWLVDLMSVISSESTSTGDAGEISIGVLNFTLDDSVVSTNVTGAGIGNGGNITVSSCNFFCQLFGFSPGPTTSFVVQNNARVQSSTATIDLTDMQIAANLAVVAAGTGTLLGSAGTVDINTQTLLVTGTNSEINTTTKDGVGGDVNITVTGTGTVNSGGQIISNTVGDGDAGSITIDGGADWTLTGSGGEDQIESSQTTNGGDGVGGLGDAGDISISANNVVLELGGSIESSTISDATGTESDGMGGTIARTSDAGNISITANDLSLTTDGSSVAKIQSNSNAGVGDAGNILLTANTLTVDRADILANTKDGAGGSITMNVTGTATIDKVTFVESKTVGTGDAGSISVTAGDFVLNDASYLRTTSEDANANGNAGDISLNITNSATITNGSDVRSSSKGFAGLGDAGKVTILADRFYLDNSQIETNNVNGAGGNISITASTQGDVTNLNNGDMVNGITVTRVEQTLVSSSASGSGNAGAVSLQGGIWNISGDVVDTGDGSELGMSTIISSSQTNTGAVIGDAGDVSINASSVNITDFAQITSDTKSASTMSDAGNVSIETTGDLNINTSSNVSSSADEGVGEAGSVTLDANNLTLDGVTISTQTSNGALGLGAINLNATTMGIITNGDTTAPQTIVQATTDGSGIAGEISITGGTWLIEGENVGADGSEGIISGGGTGSTIVSSGSTGSGAAGDVDINVNALTITDFAQVSSDTINGQGGNVVLTVATTGLVSENAEVTANTTGTGQAGNVVLNGLAAGQGDWTVNTNAVISSNANTGANGTGNAGRVVVDSNTLLVDNAILSTGTADGTDVDAGLISIDVDTSVTLQNSAVVSSGVGVSGGAATATGSAGQISIITDSGGATGADFVLITGGSKVTSGVDAGDIAGTGNAGNIDITSDTFTLSGAGSEVSTNNINGATPASISILANTNGFINTGGQVMANTSGNGNAGQVNIGTIGVGAGVGNWTISGSGGQNQIETSQIANGLGDAGDININVSKLTLSNSGKVASSTESTAISGMDRSNAGNINVTVNDGVAVDWTNDTTFENTADLVISGGIGGFYSVACNLGGSNCSPSATPITGAAGSISITTESIFTRTADIVAYNEDGAGGAITINADNALITAVTYIRSDTLGTGTAGGISFNGIDGNQGGTWVSNNNLISSNSLGSAVGNAGSIAVNIDEFTMSGGTLGTSGVTAGNAGNIDITVSGTTNLNSNAQIISASNTGTGNAGSVAITSSIIAMNNADVTTTTDSGTGGIITLTATDTMAASTITNGSTVSANTDGIADAGLVALNGPDWDISGAGTSISSDANAGSGGGNAGGVDVNVTSLLVEGGAIISSSTESSGDAGAVTVVSNDITLQTLGEISSSANAVGTTGNAGAVDITTATLTMNNGVIRTANRDGNLAAGTITIDATTIANISNGSKIIANTIGMGDAGLVTLDGPDWNISGAGTQVASNAGATSSGDAGAVVVDVTSLLIEAGAIISTSTESSGDAGTVTVVSDDITLQTLGEISSSANAVGTTGNAGAVDITTATLTMNNGVIRTANRDGNLAAGTITIDATTIASISNGSKIIANTIGMGDAGLVSLSGPDWNLSGAGTQVSSNANMGSSGDAGAISVSGSNLTVMDNAEISTNTGVASTGNAGAISISTTNVNILAGGEVSSSSADGAGNAGSVIINSSTLTMNDGEITTETSDGAGGLIDITSGNVTVSNMSDITADTDGTGDAGDIQILASDVAVNSGSVISSSSQMGTGSAGNISIEAGDITVNNASVRTVNNAGVDQANITLNATNPSTGIITNGAVVTASTIGAGDAGSISLLGPNWIVSGASTQVTSSTSGDGDAGQITATTGNFLLDAATISTNSTSAGDSGAILINSGLITLTNGGTIQSNVSGTGDGGVVTLTSASDIFLSSGAEVSTNTTPNAAPIIEGDAGNIFVNAVGSLSMISSLLTSSTTSDGEAGTVTINTGDSVYLLDSTILVDSTGATTAGVGGGNLNVTTGILVLDGSTLDASAGSGTGGNVSITADFFFISPDSVIDVSSGSGASGTVSVNAVAVDLSGSLNALKVKFKDSGKLLRQACATKGATSNSSSFIVNNGIEGIPSSPVDFQSGSTLDVIVSPNIGGQGFNSSNNSGAVSPTGTALFATIACGGF